MPYWRLPRCNGVRIKNLSLKRKVLKNLPRNRLPKTDVFGGDKTRLFPLVFVFKRRADGVAAGACGARSYADAFGCAIALAVIVDAVFDTAGNAANMIGHAFVVMKFHALYVPLQKIIVL